MNSLNGGVFGSSAVERAILPNVDEWCVHCCGPIRYVAQGTTRRVIANVYAYGRWKRVDNFHAHCYAEARQPFGVAVPSAVDDPA
jgi:hypothetical protein